MTHPAQAKAATLRELHDDGILVLPNAWDAASAAVIARAGARAIATTSGGVSWALGHPDGQQLARAEMIEHVRRIAATVEVPVSADVEGGYGPAGEDVAATVEAVIAAGAVGVNLEDSETVGGPLFSVDEQVRRLRAARRAAADAGLPELVINARTDIFLFGIGAPETRFDAVVERGLRYAEAGADVLFVPGLIDLAMLKDLVAAVALPINVMAWPGAPTVSEFAAAGVRRVSVGTALAQAAYTAALRAAEELLTTGSYDTQADALGFGEINALLPTAD